VTVQFITEGFIKELVYFKRTPAENRLGGWSRVRSLIMPPWKSGRNYAGFWHCV